MTHPGVYIEETTGGRTIAGVPTSTTAFLGRAVSGPVNDPITIAGFADFERTFGGLALTCPMSYAVRDFFLNGGAQAIIVRLYKDAGTNSTAGAEGAPLDQASYEGSRADETGLYALEKADQFNLLCIPPDTGDGTTLPAVYRTALAYCETRRAMVIVDPPAHWNTVAAARDGLDADIDFTGPAARNAALYFPRLIQSNPLLGGQAGTFVPCGAVAGVMARTDALRGAWKAPAGADASLLGTMDLSVTLTEADNGVLNPLGINCLRALPGTGPVVWGSRTLRGADQFADEYKYIPVRRLVLYIEESLDRGTRWAVFEPNDEPLWAQLRQHVGTFMQTLFRQGALQGRSADEAYFVKVGRETMTQGDIDLGIMNLVVGFAPIKPAEFVIIRIRQQLEAAPAATSPPADDQETWAQQNQAYLSAALHWLRLRLLRLGRSAETPTEGPSDAEVAQAAAAMAEAESVDPSPALLQLRGRLGLSRFEREALLLCAAVELDPTIGALCAHARHDPSRPYPTFALMTELFDEPDWEALSPDRPLRYGRLIEIHQQGAEPLTAGAIRADERIVDYIKGSSGPDDPLTPLLIRFNGRKLRPVATWNRIVLPPPELDQLRQLADEVRRPNRGPGMSALFAGESGTGKTMAAEVLANHLRHDLYRVDMSAVVSTYIGETEKNLDRLFDAAGRGDAILFFDEADALFGRRTDVRDSHDRYANVESNYLLQRVESYEGLVILATNRKSALDEAFTRRLRFAIDFPFPAEPEREAIWRRTWPAGIQVEAIDFGQLAQFSLTGGRIASAATKAAFRAAERGTSVTMPLVLDTIRSELHKLERP